MIFITSYEAQITRRGGGGKEIAFKKFIEMKFLSIEYKTLKLITFEEKKCIP